MSREEKMGSDRSDNQGSQDDMTDQSSRRSPGLAEPSDKPANKRAEDRADIRSSCESDQSARCYESHSSYMSDESPHGDVDPDSRGRDISWESYHRHNRSQCDHGTGNATDTRIDSCEDDESIWKDSVPERGHYDKALSDGNTSPVGKCDNDDKDRVHKDEDADKRQEYDRSVH